MAGVSVATVSYVVNETRNLRPETRHRVLTAIQRLFDSPNAARRGREGGRPLLRRAVIQSSVPCRYGSTAKALRLANRGPGLHLRQAGAQGGDERRVSLLRGEIDGAPLRLHGLVEIAGLGVGRSQRAEHRGLALGTQPRSALRERNRLGAVANGGVGRSEERRVGKEWRYRWAP